jgi:hypothetical protein
LPVAKHKAFSGNRVESEISQCIAAIGIGYLLDQLFFWLTCLRG